MVWASVSVRAWVRVWGYWCDAVDEGLRILEAGESDGWGYGCGSQGACEGCGMEGSYGRLRPYMEKIRQFTVRNAPYTIEYVPYTLRIRSPYISVYLRIRSRSDTIVIRSQVLWRNTVVYGVYMACIRSYTTPYTTVYDRLRNR
jgi:hypothetical protein